MGTPSGSHEDSLHESPGMWLGVLAILWPSTLEKPVENRGLRHGKTLQNPGWSVVFLEHDLMIVPETVGNGKIIPTDEIIFFRRVGIPPTRW